MVVATHKQSIKRFLAGLGVTLALMLAVVTPAFAADYNCGAYGAGTYDNGAVCGTATTDDGLVNTGQALSLVIPAALILLGTLMLFRVRRKARRSPTPTSQQ
ncbi:MAG TPA: hypothetical protein VK694_00790 [Verrucomicrobiae bacterium]|nr:hypothetical protein [Verrucomicrobiae bacterium]